MEYFQIADMFGRRRRPRLSLYLREGQDFVEGQIHRRQLILGIEDQGRALAKFPSIRFKSVPNMALHSIDGDEGFGLPLHPSEPGTIIFAGGADHVIYPGTVVKIATFDQFARPTNWVRFGEGYQELYFDEYSLTVDLFADEMAVTKDTKSVPRREIH